MKRLLIALFALSLTMAFVLQACGDDEEEAIPGGKFGGTLRIVPEGSIQAIDIQNTTSGVVQNVRWHVAEGLFQTDRNIALQPMLVDEWSKSSDELTWRFTLRDVKFQNGEKVTADDVVGSFARVQDNLGVWKLLRKTFNATIEADGDKVVVVRVSEPTALVLDGLHSEQNFPGPIVPKEFYSLPLEETASALPIGTGPYKFKSWAPGDRWIAERWEDYKPRSEPGSNLSGRHTAYIDRVEFLEIPDVASAIAALETGQVDVLDEFKAEFTQQIKGNPNLNLFQGKPGAVTHVTINNLAPPFNDVRARMAVQLAFPAEKGLTAVAGDPENWRLCHIHIGCGTRWDTPQAKADAAPFYNVQDVERARALIEEAGLVGTTVRIMQPLDVATMSDLAVITAEVLNDIGFDAELVAMDWATMNTRRTDQTLWEAFHTWVSGSRVAGPLTRTPLQKEGWHNKYQDTTGKMTQLYENFLKARTEDEQVRAWEQINKHAHEDAVRPLIGEWFPPLAATKALKNWDPNPYPVYFNVWLER